MYPISNKECRKVEIVEGGRAGIYTRRGSPGFTLVELLVVIGIFAIVMAGIYTIFVRSNRVYLAQNELVAAQQEVRAALDIVGREMRMAGLIADENKASGSDPINSVPVFTTTGAPTWSGSASAPIGTATETILAFQSDLDGDDYTEAVLYLYDATAKTVTREALIWDTTGTYGSSGWNATATGGGQLFLENIDAYSLKYQLEDGTETTTPSAAQLDNIRGVEITVTARTEHAIEPYEGGKKIRNRQLQSRIDIRNLGL
jgi:prepilin-type N-terminal cleavage/methylation domain-containing protein